MRASVCILVAVLGGPACYGTYGGDQRQPLMSESLVPSSSHIGVMAPRTARRAAWTGEDLMNLGGPVIPESTVYAIWWGDRSRFPGDAMSGLDAFLSGLDRSTYLAIADQYVGRPARATFLGHILEPSAPPDHSPATEEIVSKVCQVLSEAQQTPSATALYLVFTDNFPQQNDFCAWHDSGKCPNGYRIHVAYLPNVQSATGCDPGDLFQCNQFGEGTRALANVTAHEVMEMITDPEGTGWVDRQGEEIADKCAWTFGKCVALGSTQWQLQKEWSNADHGCVQEKNAASRNVAVWR